MDQLKYDFRDVRAIYDFVRNHKTSGPEMALGHIIGDRGNPDVLTFNFGMRRLHYVFNPEWVPDILRQPEHFQKPERIGILASLKGKTGIFTSGFHLWQKQKRTLKPHFTKNAIPNFVAPIVEETQSLIRQWSQTGRTDDLYEDFRDLSLSMLFKTSFAYDIPSDRRAEIKDSVDILNGYLIKSATSPLTYLFNRHVFMPDNVKEAMSCLQDFMADLCRPYIKDREEGNLVSDIMESAGFYAAANAQDKRDALDQTHDEIWQLIAAGYESTASSLTWAFAELARMPEMQDRLYQEAATVLGQNTMTMQSARSLPLHYNYMAEILRLYPTLHTSVPRKAMREMTVGQDGFKVSKNDYVLIPLGMIQRDPKWFDDPNRVDPDRMSADRIQGRPKHAYMPFLAGAHTCSGQHMFYLQAMTVLSETVRQFSLSANTPMPEKIYKSSVVPTTGYSLTFRPLRANDNDFLLTAAPKRQCPNI